MTLETPLPKQCRLCHRLDRARRPRLAMDARGRAMRYELWACMEYPEGIPTVNLADKRCERWMGNDPAARHPHDVPPVH